MQHMYKMYLTRVDESANAAVVLLVRMRIEGLMLITQIKYICVQKCIDLKFTNSI